MQNIKHCCNYRCSLSNVKKSGGWVKFFCSLRLSQLYVSDVWFFPGHIWRPDFKRRHRNRWWSPEAIVSHQCWTSIIYVTKFTKVVLYFNLKYILLIKCNQPILNYWFINFLTKQLFCSNEHRTGSLFSLVLKIPLFEHFNQFK